MSRTHWSSFARFRCSVAPICIEIGGYKRLPLTWWVCPFCKTCSEDITCYKTMISITWKTIHILSWSNNCIFIKPSCLKIMTVLGSLCHMKHWNIVHVWLSCIEYYIFSQKQNPDEIQNLSCIMCKSLFTIICQSICNSCNNKPWLK